MKKILALAIILLALIGCTNKPSYPIAGRAYKHVILHGDSFDVYKFMSNGECDVDYYFNYGALQNGGIYDYKYWMEADSIFISVDAEPKYKYMRGFYHDAYIILQGDTLWEYKK